MLFESFLRMPFLRHLFRFHSESRSRSAGFDHRRSLCALRRAIASGPRFSLAILSRRCAATLGFFQLRATAQEREQERRDGLSLGASNSFPQFSQAVIPSAL